MKLLQKLTKGVNKMLNNEMLVILGGLLVVYLLVDCLFALINYYRYRGVGYSCRDVDRPIPPIGPFSIWENSSDDLCDDLTEDQKRMMDGDIMVPPCLSKFKIECKSYKSFDFHQLFTDNKTLNKWIEQAESGNCWFLVIKVTRRGSFILFPTTMSHYFRFKNYLRYTEKYIITNYKEFWQANENAIRRLNEINTIEL